MKNINQSIIKATISVVFVMAFFSKSLYSQERVEYKLQNPITTKYLKKNLRNQSARLVLNRGNEKILKKKLKTDPLIQNIYEAIKLNAGLVLEKDLISVDIPDNPNSQKNQLGISRDFLHR